MLEGLPGDKLRKWYEDVQGCDQEGISMFSVLPGTLQTVVQEGFAQLGSYS